MPSAVSSMPARPSDPDVPIEVEMSSINSKSGSSSMDDGEEDTKQQPTMHRSSESSPPARGRRRRFPSADSVSGASPSLLYYGGRTSPSPRRLSGTVMKVGGTLSFDGESGDETDTSRSRVGASSGISGGGLTSSSPNYRRITFFPTVDEGDEEDDDSIDPAMELFDFIEDEIDGHAYDDLVPLPVRLALEENVFGWSHLFTDIVGHILYTAGGYSIAFWTITWLLLRRVPDAEGGDGGCDASRIRCAFYRRTPPDYEPILGISFEFFVVLRGILSALSAINAFRTVRRRKRVWLRNDYGSAGYKSDASRRRKAIEDTDRSTFLGRLRSGLGKRREGYLVRKLRKKLQRATDRFEKRHRSRVRLLRRHGGLDAAETHHNRVKVLAQTGHVVKSRQDRAREQERLIVNMPRGGHVDVVAPGGATPRDSEQGFDNIRASSRWQSHTMAAGTMQSVAQDQIPFRSGEIHSIPYAHGGFFGAAPFMLANPFWIDILRALMPDVYVEISRRVLTAPVPRLIHWAENNPVVAAFGTAHEMEFSGRVSTLEWDVFLDPHLVRRVEIVLEERDKFLSRCVSSQSNSHHVDITANGTCHAEAFLDDPSEKATLQYYNAEIRRRTVILVERMLIAHGNLTQLILEQTGYAKKYNFSRVRRTRRTLGGGIYARQWLAVYAEALRLGMGYSDLDNQEIVSEFSAQAAEEYTSESSVELESEDDEGASTVEEEDTPLLPPTRGEEVSADRTPVLGERKSIRQSTGCDSGENALPLGQSPPLSPSTYNSFSISDPPAERTVDPVASGATHNNDTSFRRRQRSRRSASRSVNEPSEQESNPTTPSSSPQKKHRGGDGAHTTPRRTTPRQVSPSTSNHQSLSALAMSSVPETTIIESISLLKEITRCNAPLGLVLDVKSRHVSHRVWALVVDALRDAGARVEGIASFTISEIRDISSYCSSPCNEIYFFHSAGDIQQACYRGLLKRGDKVFFNAGSLLWHKKDVNMLDVHFVTESILDFLYFDCEKFKTDYCLQPYARITRGRNQGEQGDANGIASVGNEGGGGGDTATADEQQAERDGLLMNVDGRHTTWSTVQDYKDYFNLSIGLYCQEFAIDDAAIDFIVHHVNTNTHVYNLGLSWGGVNGVTVRGVQPDRFTNTDGFWNQRYAGASWDPTLMPSSIDESAAAAQNQGPVIGLD